MSEFAPISTLEEFDNLNGEDCVEGYLDAMADAPEPGNNRTRSYWHGWRMRMMDAGKLAIPPEHRALIHLVVERNQTRRVVKNQEVKA